MSHFICDKNTPKLTTLLEVSGTNMIKTENSSLNKLNVWGECV